MKKMIFTTAIALTLGACSKTDNVSLPLAETKDTVTAKEPTIHHVLEPQDTEFNMTVGHNIQTSLKLNTIENNKVTYSMDVTEDALWTSADPSVIQVCQGEVEAYSKGTTEIMVDYKGTTFTIPVRVDDKYKTTKRTKDISIYLTEAYEDREGMLFVDWYSNTALLDDIVITLMWSVNSDDTVDCIHLKKGDISGTIACFPKGTGTPSGCYIDKKPDKSFLNIENSFENERISYSYRLKTE